MHTQDIVDMYYVEGHQKKSLSLSSWRQQVALNKLQTIQKTYRALLPWQKTNRSYEINGIDNQGYWGWFNMKIPSCHFETGRSYDQPLSTMGFSLLILWHFYIDIQGSNIGIVYSINIWIFEMSYKRAHCKTCSSTTISLNLENRTSLRAEDDNVIAISHKRDS